MNLVNRIFVCVLFLSSFSFSQDTINKYPRLNVIDGDTVLIFNILQGKELIKINETKNQYLDLFDLSKKEIQQKNTIIQNQEYQLDNYKIVINDYDTLVRSMGNLISLSEITIKEQKKEIRKQKMGKWMALIGLSAISILAIIN